jgi:hypothetical protein
MSDTVPSDDPSALLDQHNAIQAEAAAEAKARLARREEEARRGAAEGALYTGVYSLIASINKGWPVDLHRPDWGYWVPCMAKLIVGACHAWLEEGHPATLFGGAPPDEWTYPRRYAQTVLQAAMHGEGEEEIKNRLQVAVDKDCIELWQEFRDLPPTFLRPARDEGQPSPTPVAESHAGQKNDPQLGVEEEADPSPGLGAPLPLFLSASDLTKHLNQIAPHANLSTNSVEVELRRYRKKFPDCAVDTRDTDDGARRRNEPYWIYRTSEVWPHLLKHFRLTDG